MRIPALQSQKNKLNYFDIKAAISGRSSSNRVLRLCISSSTPQPTPERSLFLLGDYGPFFRPLRLHPGPRFLPRSYGVKRTPPDIDNRPCDTKLMAPRDSLFVWLVPRLRSFSDRALPGATIFNIFFETSTFLFLERFLCLTWTRPGPCTSCNFEYVSCKTIPRFGEFPLRDVQFTPVTEESASCTSYSVHRTSIFSNIQVGNQTRGTCIDRH